MCGVFGVVFGTDVSEATLTEMMGVWERCQDRGRDSWGVNICDFDGNVTRGSKAIVNPGEDESLGNTDRLALLVANRRGEPTTEYVEQKTDVNIQPFTSPSGDWVFTHNGTIANDKELCVKYGVTPPTRIDSYAIGVALDVQEGPKRSIQNTFRDGIQRLVGSFAILAFNRHQPDQLYYATNYKPLYVARISDSIVLSSQARHFQGWGQLYDPFTSYPLPLKQYTWGWFSREGYYVEELLEPKSERVLVVCSGGLDSATVAWKYYKEGYNVDLVHFKYGCKAEGPELDAVNKLAERIGARVHLLETDFFKRYTSTPLTDGTKPITQDRSGESGAEFAHEWVPCRNTVMFSLAAALAEETGANILALGGNMEESGAYPDNEEEFVNRWNHLSPYVTRPDFQLRFEAPLATMVKHEIVALGLKLEMPYELTWSCYQAKEDGSPCWSCGPCIMRKKAFEMNGTTDPLFKG